MKPRCAPVRPTPSSLRVACSLIFLPLLILPAFAAGHGSDQCAGDPTHPAGCGRHDCCTRGSEAARAFADSVELSVPVFAVSGAAAFPTAIPSGQRLVVELVSARCDVPAAASGIGTPIDFGVTAPLAGVPRTYHMALQRVAGTSSRDYYVANLSGGFYADPGGTTAFITYGTALPVSTANCSVTLSGHLDPQ